MKEQEFWHRADELAALTRLKQEFERFEHAPVSNPEHVDAQNLFASIDWYASLSTEDQEERTELANGIHKVVDSLVELLRHLMHDALARAPIDDQSIRTRWRAAELIGYLTRADPRLLLLGRPVRNYKGVPEELVALVFGAYVQTRRPWSIEVSYVIDLYRQRAIGGFVD